MGIYLTLKSTKILKIKMTKILLETIWYINFETKPGNEGILFRRMKRQKLQISDSSMKR